MNETTYDLGEKWKAVVTDTETRVFNDRGERVLVFHRQIVDEQILLDLKLAYLAGVTKGMAYGKEDERRRIRALLGVDG